MRIVKLIAENIKKLKAVEISPDGDVVKITGRNAQGKTSVLDAILYALAGTKSIPAKPVRDGEDKGRIEIDLGDIVVERRFTAGGENSSLTVTSKEGGKLGSPQSVIDNLIGRLAFDPLEFMRMDPKKQFESLRDLLGLDFSDMDKQRQEAYDQRTEFGRQYKSLKSQRDAVKFDPSGAKEETTSTELIEKMKAAIDQNERVSKAIDVLAQARADISRLESELTELYSKLPELEKAALEEPIDLKEIGDKVRLLDENNKNARAFIQAAELDKKIKDVEKDVKACGEKIESIDKEKQEIIEACSMPVPGLTFGAGEVLYNDLPINQASAAEQLRISVAMAMAMNPKLRVIRITDGSLLDSDSMKMIEQMAGENDYQVWMEIVDESGKVGIVIEDGSVKA